MNAVAGNVGATSVSRKALGAAAIVSRLATLDGWRLCGDGRDVAIEKTFRFANYEEVMFFVNAVAYIAKRADHHPDLSVHFSRCVVRFNTHDVGGITEFDFVCAGQVDALKVGLD